MCARTALAHQRKLHEEIDPQHQHAPLRTPELRKLLRVVRRSRTLYKGCNGQERYRLYHFAAETGFRAGEIRSLTSESFDLSKPSVTVQAAYSRKRKRTETQPLSKQTARELKRYFSKRAPTAAAFVIPEKTAETLRGDLALAGIPYETTAGFHDFHALRHTFISEAGRHVRSFAALQSLARHSTPMLTARYAHARYGWTPRKR